MSDCFPIEATVYTGMDNFIQLGVYAYGGVKTDLSDLTRVVVVVGATTVDISGTGSTVIWWTDTATYRDLGTIDVLKLALGGQSIAAGTYTNVPITIYTGTYTGGLRIENKVKLTVV